MLEHIFWHREAIGRVEIAFTGSDLDLSTPDGPARLARALGVPGVHLMRQVHGCVIADLDDHLPEADGCVVDRPGAAVARAADCVTIALVDPDRPLAAVVHCGRLGLTAGVVPAAVQELRSRGAGSLVARVGPRACGRCYEVPEAMADEVAARVPQARSTTSWGTPALDIGAGVVSQLMEAEVGVRDLGGCTIENDDFFSHRRQRDRAGRHGVAVVVR